MNAHQDLRGAFVWTDSRKLPPLPGDDFYQEYEDRQHDRWAAQQYIEQCERKGKRDFLWVVSLLGIVVFVCAALVFGARGAAW